MASNYEIGEADGIAKGMAACRVLMAKLADARRDSAEWKEQHENLLAIYRDALTEIQRLKGEIAQHERWHGPVPSTGSGPL